MKMIAEVCEKVIGMQRDDAEQFVVNSGYIFRVVNVDGASLKKTCDYRTNRINVHLLNGKVISTTTG